jgi:hypothetical protein
VVTDRVRIDAQVAGADSAQVWPSPGGHQQSLGLRPRAVRQLDHDAALSGGGRDGGGPGDEGDPIAPQDLIHGGGVLGLLHGERVPGGFHDRHLGAEAPERLRQLQSDGTRTEHDQRPGMVPASTASRFVQ